MARKNPTTTNGKVNRALTGDGRKKPVKQIKKNIKEMIDASKKK
ncbi:hypothetical protein [Methanococcus maripaludis]|uniref:Uncharacterized protein n=1 Tax=Methanococcus maripaludis TaxID=39152 RepID=A0A2L1C984_METMI|nr:hypothetical protein [Methanococcus maripaludis]AVB75915.1 hypothetical protein MMJJ_04980 [Methanococcus maripaludis]